MKRRDAAAHKRRLVDVMISLALAQTVPNERKRFQGKVIGGLTSIPVLKRKQTRSLLIADVVSRSEMQMFMLSRRSKNALPKPRLALRGSLNVSFGWARMLRT